MGHFLVSLRDVELKEMQDRVLETLSGLLNVQKMVKEAQSKGKQLAIYNTTKRVNDLTKKTIFRSRYLFIGRIR